MNKIRTLTLVAIGTLITPLALANNWPGQVRSGEAGYKVGCAYANSRGVQVCGETASYRSMQRRLEQERLERERREREQLRRSYPNYRNVPR